MLRTGHMSCFFFVKQSTAEICTGRAHWGTVSEREKERVEFLFQEHGSVLICYPVSLAADQHGLFCCMCFYKLKINKINGFISPVLSLIRRHLAACSYLILREITNWIRYSLRISSSPPLAKTNSSKEQNITVYIHKFSALLIPSLSLSKNLWFNLIVHSDSLFCVCLGAVWINVGVHAFISGLFLSVCIISPLFNIHRVLMRQ